MHDNALPSLDKALTTGLNEITLERTLQLYAAHVATGNERLLNFRGDVAEHHQYDKIKPSMQAARSQGHVVYIEAVSQKTGQPGHYQILANQWKLLEVLARLD